MILVYGDPSSKAHHGTWNTWGPQHSRVDLRLAWPHRSIIITNRWICLVFAIDLDMISLRLLWKIQGFCAITAWGTTISCFPFIYHDVLLQYLYGESVFRWVIHFKLIIHLLLIWVPPGTRRVLSHNESFDHCNVVHVPWPSRTWTHCMATSCLPGLSPTIALLFNASARLQIVRYYDNICHKSTTVWTTLILTSNPVNRSALATNPQTSSRTNVSCCHHNADTW